jgi:catechol 2,3-dioxygenase-like lactoylglutathione lyase family enzyme
MRWAVKTAFLSMIAGLAWSTGWAQTASAKPGILHLRYVTVLVRNYDEALTWYTHILGMKKVEDRTFGPGQRWIVVAPENDNEPGIVLEVPHSDISRAERVGKETNWVFQVADCAKFYETLQKQGVHFIEPPKQQPWGTMQAIFEDPYGNIFVAESQPPSATGTHIDHQ